MRSSVAPSLQILFALADAAAELSRIAVCGAWERWLGPQRFGRHWALLQRSGWVAAPSTAGNLSRVLRLTAAGRLAAAGGRDPEAQWDRSWDGRWRVALFDIPEQRRALRVKLRRRLAELGFGYLQNSVWVSPDPCERLQALVRDLSGEAESFSFIEARPCAGETDADVVKGAWSFPAINRNYANYLEVLKHQPRRIDGVAARRSWLQVEWKAWLKAVRSDPLLPEPLLPTPYLGREAWRQRCSALRHLIRAG
ncbi:PaaX family transcriptional regulator C-terminal domain-containing protein [Opitutus terrae]|uniref:Putative transcriptional regulator, PaaX family n=1 Tax=Opitutus terrae (strain DSM 11246 / JCM 15787 / PB90-1) TaxID=452637 RepID=B1ZX33_OPITP|nr:PaaX family transcriptional regulator C-terminal domain-containing protein [Opitutus terrae]ACB75147.1 putative transcriptional regulator, PaaX family [Opitutus terrae PB90-1]